MDFDLPEEHEALRATVRDFAEREIAPVAAELDRTKASRTRSSGKLGELGWMGIPFPEEYGGAGADTLAYALTVEELARVDSSVAITLCAHSSLGTQPIYLFGTEEQKQRVAARSSPPAGGSRRSASPSPRRAPTPATRAPARASTAGSG